VKYTIEVAATAEEEAEAAFNWLSERTSVHAQEWLDGLYDALHGLAEFPTRWPLARENRRVEEEIRQLLYGKLPHVYRVLFVIRGNVVHVLHIRHGARRAMRRKEIVFPE
jgi:plasmid stabilization system protein ParE